MSHITSFRGNLIARNTALNFIGQVVPLLVAVVAIPVITRELGIDRFGLLALAWIILGYFSLFDLGLAKATTKYVAEAMASGRIARIPQIVWPTVIIHGVLGICGALILALAARFLVDFILNIPMELAREAIDTFRILALSIPVVLVSASLRGVLEAGQRFDLVNAVKAPSSAATYLLPAFGALLGLRLPGIVLMLVVARAVTLVAFFTLCLITIPALRAKVLLRRDVIRPLLTFGGWVTVSNLVSPLMVYLDRFLIGSLLAISAVAYYSAPFEMVTRLAIIPSSLLLTLFPAVAILRTSGNQEELQGISARSVKYLLICMGPIVIVLALFSREILELWLGRDFALQGTLVLQVLVVGVMVNSLARVPFTVLQGTGRPDVTAKIHLFELLVYVPMAWVLIANWGILGAALGWTLRVTLDAALLFIASRRIGVLALSSLFASGLLRALAALSAFLAAAYLISRFGQSLPFQAVALIFSVLLFSTGLWLYVLDNIERKHAIDLFRSASHWRSGPASSLQ